MCVCVCVCVWLGLGVYVCVCVWGPLGVCVWLFVSESSKKNWYLFQACSSKVLDFTKQATIQKGQNFYFHRFLLIPNFHHYLLVKTYHLPGRQRYVHLPSNLNLVILERLLDDVISTEKECWCLFWMIVTFFPSLSTLHYFGQLPNTGSVCVCPCVYVFPCKWVLESMCVCVWVLLGFLYVHENVVMLGSNVDNSVIL